MGATQKKLKNRPNKNYEIPKFIWGMLPDLQFFQFLPPSVKRLILEFLGALDGGLDGGMERGCWLAPSC